MTHDIEAARTTLARLTKNSMKPLSLPQHDINLAALITAQAAAASALQSRIASAERIKSAFTASPSEAGLAQAINAQQELVALLSIADSLPPAEHRERQARDAYVAQHRDELIGILTTELDTRLKPRPQWRRTIAAKIARLSERLALREEGALALAAASAEADQLDNSIANSSAAEGGARRYLNDFFNNPTFAALNDVRGSLSTLDF